MYGEFLSVRGVLERELIVVCLGFSSFKVKSEFFLIFFVCLDFVREVVGKRGFILVGVLFLVLFKYLGKVIEEVGGLVRGNRGVRGGFCKLRGIFRI